MKEIVIKLSDVMYSNFIKRKAYYEVVHEQSSIDPSIELTLAVINGKVLPKGHGRLIEVTPRLEAYLSTFQSYTGIDEAPYEYADELIRNADTVVEADNGEELTNPFGDNSKTFGG